MICHLASSHHVELHHWVPPHITKSVAKQQVRALVSFAVILCFMKVCPVEWMVWTALEPDLCVKGTNTCSLKLLKGTLASKSVFEEGLTETENASHPAPHT